MNCHQKNERKIMQTKSICSDRTSQAARFTVAPSPGLKCRTLLWLALPLALTAGYAADPNWSAIGNGETRAPAPIAASVSDRQAADNVINREIFEMYLTDSSFRFSRVITVNDGVVTLYSPMNNNVEAQPDSAQQQKINDKIMALPGVNQVIFRQQSEHGNVASTPAPAQPAIPQVAGN
jgi:hypothetical protein